MKKHLVTIVVTTFVVSNIVATLCFRACGKRIDVTDRKNWKIVDDEWRHIIDL